MAYSLGTRCLAEFIGMIIVIYTGEAALANELLPNTKGHAMGWGWTVFTFGFAFFAPLQAFAKVSAKLNPAMCLAQWVWGNLTGVDFVCLSLAELAGAFVGAVLHWIHFLPHYKTLPEPPALDKDDGLLRRRDHMRESALQIASYATKPDRVVTSNPLNQLRHTFYYLRGHDVIHEETPEELLQEYYAVSDPLARHHSAVNGKAPVQPLARRTIQVADLQRHLADAHVERALRRRTCPKCASIDPPGATPPAGSHTHSHDDAEAWEHGAGAGGSSRAQQQQQQQQEQQQQQLPRASSLGDDGGARGSGGGGGGARRTSKDAHAAPTGGDDCRLVLDAPSSKSKQHLERVYGSSEMTAQKQRAHALYKAAVVADQNAKLSIFATRPAIYAPLYNFTTETMGTVALLLLALLIELQARRFPENSDARLFYEVGLQNLLICFTVVILIAGLGGPTAYAANPARDLGPRIAHALLPIPGKGSSEWGYAWIPVFAPLVGGVIAGALYIAIEEMQFPGGGTRGGGLFVG